jgi:hypothetical protein
VIPIYDKYFTADDIKAMLAFYDSPTGRKVTAAMVPMTQEQSQINDKDMGEIFRTAR